MRRVVAPAPCPLRHQPLRPCAPCALRLPLRRRGAGPRLTGRSPATSASSASTCSAASTQTNEKPAVQGGFDLGHKSGFYVGTWASNVSWISDLVHPPNSVSASIGVGLLRRLQGKPACGLRLRPGRPLLLLVSGQLRQRAERLHEARHDRSSTPALTWKFLSAKYSYSVNNKTFGIPDSRGSSYRRPQRRAYDVIDKVNDAIGKVTLFDVGHQWFTRTPPTLSNNGYYNYGDWKVGRVDGDLRPRPWASTAPAPTRGPILYESSTARTHRSSQFVGYVQKTF